VWSKTDKGVYGGFAPVLIIIYWKGLNIIWEYTV
jgi:hypothetical protein